MLHPINGLLRCVWLFAAVHSRSFAQAHPDTIVPLHRIAIIGAGAGGSSAAYHLRELSSSLDPIIPVEITIFEASERVGGRTTTVNALDDSRYPTEVGGSIFVKVNHILFNATRDFDLASKSRSDAETGSLYDLGIWNGQEFLFTIANENDGNKSGLTNKWKGWWDIAKMLWKYGLSPIKTQRLTKTVIGKFLSLYDEHYPFSSLEDVVFEAGLEDVVSSSGRDVLLQAGISEEFTRDIIQSSTRVNYAQNLDTIHGLESLVCMAIEGAMAVEGGNWQIFDQFVKRSAADIHLRTAVTTIERSEQQTWILHTNTTDVASEFDTVILAAPYQYANLTVSPPLEHTPKEIDYVKLYVTLFTSPYRPSPSYFGLESQEQVPDSILTTVVPGLETHQARGRDAVGATKFWSLSTLRVLDSTRDDDLSSDGLDPTADVAADDDMIPIHAEHTKQQILGDHGRSNSRSRSTDRANSERQYLYKIFSPEPISASLLSNMFGFNYSSSSSTPHATTLTSTSESTTKSDPITNLPKHQVSWSYTKIWNSYPYLPPLAPSSSSPPPSESHGHGHDQDKQPKKAQQTPKRNEYPPLILDKNFYYTSAIEPFISTMETSALSGRNIAALIWKDMIEV